MQILRKLLLVRHANALEKIQGNTDYNRSLSALGLRQATYLGELLKSSKAIPDAIICSSATRAAATANIFRERLKDGQKDIIEKKDLYEASVRTILHNVNVLKNEWKTVLIVAHNPGIHYFAEFITGKAIDGMEPCAMVEITFDFESWAMVSEQTGTFQKYTPAYQSEDGI